jgi:hypothetical protein
MPARRGSAVSPLPTRSSCSMPRGFITNQSCPSSWRKVFPLPLMFVPSMSWQMTRFVKSEGGEKKGNAFSCWVNTGPMNNSPQLWGALNASINAINAAGGNAGTETQAPSSFCIEVSVPWRFNLPRRTPDLMNDWTANEKELFCFPVYLDLKGPPNDGCGGESPQPSPVQREKRAHASSLLPGF